MEETVAEWKPFSTAPKTGHFLVFMPGEREGSRVQAARWAGETLVIGNAFAFDMSKPTHWAPPLEEPKDGQ